MKNREAPPTSPRNGPSNLSDPLNPSEPLKLRKDDGGIQQERDTGGLDISADSNRIIESTTKEFKETNSSAIINSNVDIACRSRNSHTLGVFCHECRAMPMPWGAQLPHVEDAQGRAIQESMYGSILDGVKLNDATAIAIMSIVAYLQWNKLPLTTIEGFEDIVRQYPTSGVVGLRVADLVMSISMMALEKDRVPEFFEVIHLVLQEPNVTAETFQARAIGESSDWATRTDECHIDNSTSNKAELGASVDTKPAAQNIAADSQHGTNHLNLRPRSYVDQTTSTQAMMGPRGLQSQSPVSLGSILLNATAAERSPSPMGFESRPEATGNQKHAPPVRAEGPWEFVAGTDLDPAELGKPKPSKFFLVRQKKLDNNIKDVRQYPGWESFDWNNPDGIAALNKARAQIRKRTSGNIADHHPPWTEREKDELKSLIQRELARPGISAANINWKTVSADLKSKFDNVTQKSGENLARWSSMGSDGKLKYKPNKPRQLDTDRVGGIKRTAGALAHQVHKYHDTKKLLEDSRKKRTHGTMIMMDEGGENADGAEVEFQDKFPAKVAKKRRYTPKTSKGPSKPPPRGPDSDDADASGGPSSQATQRTPLPS